MFPASDKFAVARIAALVLVTSANSLFGCSDQPAQQATMAAGSSAGGTPERTNTAGDSSQRMLDAGTPAAESGKPSAANGVSGTAGSAGTPASSAAAGTGAGSGAGAGAAPQAGTGADAGVRDAATPANECQRCSAYAAPEVTGMVQPAELSALSGVAMSRSQPELLYAHNDHDRPVVYALDLQGRLHARVTLTAAETNDIEDIAVGQCGADTCVYLADVGDNAAQRGEYGILRFVEPELPSAPGMTELTPSFEQLRFRYEDGSHNAESLLVAPNGNLYIITKNAPGSGGNVEATGPSDVYRIAADAFTQSDVAEAQKVTTLSVPQRGEPALSAAAAHPCGLGFLARTYDRVYEFLVPSGADFEAAFSAAPQVVAMPDEPQSEGIDYRADGRGFVTSGEGASAPLVLTQCAP